MTNSAFVTGVPVSTFTSTRNQAIITPRRMKNALSKTQQKQSRRVKQPTMKVYDVEIVMEGEKHTIPIDEDQTLLEGIEEYGLEVLYSCRAGVCVTCAAKLLEGEIDPGFASITDDLKAEGYVLTCSAYPRSEGIKMEMNHFDDAYQKQYGQYEKENQ